MRLLPGVLLAMSFGMAPYASRAADTAIRSTYVAQIAGRRIPIPMELYLTPVGPSRIEAKVAGNLAGLQRVLPGMLTRVIQDTCGRRIGLEINEVHSVGDRLYGSGRLQVIIYACNAENDIARRHRLIGNIAAVEFILDGKIEDNCVMARLAQIKVDPSGLVGAFLNVTGISRRAGEAVRAELNQTLNDRDTCIDMPEVLETVRARVTSGGFRDFGSGTMGFVVKGTIDVSAANLIRVLTLLQQSGALAGGCDCADGR